jgi:hypothetical protein
VDDERVRRAIAGVVDGVDRDRVGVVAMSVTLRPQEDVMCIQDFPVGTFGLVIVAVATLRAGTRDGQRCGGGSAVVNGGVVDGDEPHS